MLYLLLWVQLLLACLLCIALAVALLFGRRRSAWLIVVGALMLMLLPVALTSFLARLVHLGAKYFSIIQDYEPAAWWLASIVGLSIPILWIAGSRPLRAEPPRRWAACWSRRGLLVGLVVVLFANGTTLWWIDRGVRQQLADLDAEAKRLALSVAPQSVPPEVNAAPLYRAAHQAMQPDGALPHDWDGIWERSGTPDGEKPDYRDPALQKQLQKHQPALQLALQAASRPSCVFDRDFSNPGWDMLVPEPYEAQEISRLLSLAALVAAANGDQERAIVLVRAQLELAQHMASEPMTISLLVASTIEERAWMVLQHVLSTSPESSPTWDQVIIEPACTHLQRYQQALIMEEALGLVLFVGLQDFSNLDKQLLHQPKYTDEPGAGLCLRVFTIPQDLAAYRAMLRWGQQLAKHPYYEVAADWQAGPAEFKAGAGAGGLFTGLLEPAFYDLVTYFTRTDALRAVSTSAVASAQYRSEQGRWPTNLKELVPKYLPSLPIDPFDGQPIRFIEREGQRVYYSIGQDGQDDLGRPIDSESHLGDITFSLPLTPAPPAVEVP